ncbi:MAG: tRNA (guanosine(46)-N7)-methyltransferase TrmB [Advenella sp.]|uniref:tRNA (guanine-N(7)-)-methyltransferase n=1 Tax=Advenella kashmirensis TaxID=310575 RepID=A0A356LJB2_9BURK|nr:tRNA (guanosine(46)-N7)-methyltransferase TrmB [Advenella sp. FME57]HBP30949.1 tRNA (guanosine(46)-N7)-methyltransferase TrmB [Advenella kashmirensis]
MTIADSNKNADNSANDNADNNPNNQASNPADNQTNVSASNSANNEADNQPADSNAAAEVIASKETTNPDELKVRHIRSFVHRRSHMTPGQKQAVELHMDKWALPYQDGLLDYDQAFGRNAPTILEIGFGMGETTQKIAQLRANENFLGVEVFNAGVGALLKRIEESGVSNIRIIQHDAVEVVQNMIAPDSLAGVHIYFPDPWPKKRHHKRRLVRPEFIALLASRIKPGGYIHCATDWEDYAGQMLEVLGGEALLRNTCTDYAPKPDYRPQTKFETRGLRLGHGIRDLVFKRI